MAPVSSVIGSGKYISATRTALALSVLIVSDCIAQHSGSSTPVNFFLIFYFPFSQVLLPSIFMKLVKSAGTFSVS